MAYWTAEEEERAVVLAKAGYCGRQIAKVLGRSKNSVLCKLRRLDIRPPVMLMTASHLAEQRDRLMEADLRGGMTHRELAEKYGLAINHVSHRLSLRGATLTTDERQKRRLAAMRRNGTTTGKRAVWPDCPPHLQRDYATLRRYGIPAAEARKALEARA